MKALNLPNCVVVDHTASPAAVPFYQSVFEASISVVTCNKIGNSASFEQFSKIVDIVDLQIDDSNMPLYSRATTSTLNHAYISAIYPMEQSLSH